MEKILLSTTSELNGWDIVEYVDIVSAQIVIGTGVFSDLFAELTDFMGGNSDSYEKQLKQLNNKALSNLSEQAKSLNANAVVGIKLDYDEISGKGKQMFMLTATGTAVIAKKINTKFIELDNMLENIIDEDLAYGRVGGLPLKRIKIDKLLNLLNYESSILAELNEKIFKYYRITGRYSEAEDLLYTMIGKSNYMNKKRWVEEGNIFYKNILNRTDAELESGNLPRNEVLDGINELNKKYNFNKT